jgi:hypothetical protein
VPKSPTKNYYIFGLQRSGTNYIEQLFKENFEHFKRANTGEHCWKHNINIPDDLNCENDRTIIVYKNPLTWVESICYRTPVDYVRKQRVYPAWETADIPDEFVINELNILNIAETYRHWKKNWIHGYDSPNKIVIPYEDLLVETKRIEFLERVQTKFDLKRKKDSYGYWWHDMPPGRVTQSKFFKEEHKRYYREGKPQHLTEAQIDKINEIINRVDVV